MCGGGGRVFARRGRRLRPLTAIRRSLSESPSPSPVPPCVISSNSGQALWNSSGRFDLSTSRSRALSAQHPGNDPADARDEAQLARHRYMNESDFAHIGRHRPLEACAFRKEESISHPEMIDLPGTVDDGDRAFQQVDRLVDAVEPDETAGRAIPHAREA